MNSEQIDPLKTRGVKNPKSLDLIELSEDKTTVNLTMIEDRPWASSEEQINELEEKVNNYVDYIIDGWFAKQFPQYQGKKLQVILQCVEAPDKRETVLLEAARRYLSEKEIGFVVKVV
jgi:hypothetical protein